MGFLPILPLFLFISQSFSQFAPIILNKAALGLQTIILSNGQRVRVFPIPIQRSRVLHFKARKDGYIYRASHEIDEGKWKTFKQNVYEPFSSTKVETHDDFKRNIKNLATTEKPTTTRKSFTSPPQSHQPVYLGTNEKAKNGDFLVPQIDLKEQRQVNLTDSLIDAGSGSGDEEQMRGGEGKSQLVTVEGKVQKNFVKKGLPLIVDTLSQEVDGEIEDLLSEKVTQKPQKVIDHIHMGKAADFNNHTEAEGSIPLVENSKEYLLETVRQTRTHEVMHSPNHHPELKIDGQKIVLPRIKHHENEKKHEFTEPIRDHFGIEIPHTELHISPNATVSEIKAKILLLNQQLLELQEYVSTHTLNRRVKRQARGAGPQGDAGLARGSSGQVTAFVPLPNGDVQKFYLNPAQVGSIANPTASGPQITLGQRGDLFGSDGAVAVSPLGGVQQLGIGSPYGGLTGFGGGTSSYQTFGGFGGQYQTGGYPVSSGYGQSSFGGQQQYGQQGGGGGGGQASGQASNIPPPILEIKVPPPPKVDIPGCYVNGKGFVCCNKHLENVIDNTMKEINDKAKEQEAKTGQPACNLQASANLLQKSAEGVFGVSFESLVAPTDFASRTRFMDDLMCKTEQNGKYVIMYATPVAYPIARRR